MGHIIFPIAEPMSRMSSVIYTTCSDPPTHQLKAPSDLLAVFKGSILLKGGRGKGVEGKGTGMKGKRGEEVTGGICPTRKILAWRPL